MFYDDDIFAPLDHTYKTYTVDDRKEIFMVAAYIQILVSVKYTYLVSMIGTLLRLYIRLKIWLLVFQ